MAAATKRVGFIGAGEMAFGLAAGFVASNLMPKEKLALSDPKPSQRFLDGGFKVLSSNVELVKTSDVVFIAVKPHQVVDVLKEISPICSKEKPLLITIAAGVSLSVYEKNLPDGAHVVRVMPNLPCLVSEGACAFVPGTHASEEDVKLVEQFLSSVGICEQVAESQMDAVTALSGSGPAYIYKMILALTEGGAAHHLDAEVAQRLVLQTVRGAAAMVKETGQPPQILIDKVCSPGGTTTAAIEALDRGSFDATVKSAVDAAVKRSKELGHSS